MLNNPNWDKSIMSVESLATWLDRKPTDETYKYTDGTSCLLFQYFTDMGMVVNHVDSGRYYLKSDKVIGISYPYVLNKIAYGSCDYGNELRTFGAALERARGCITQEAKCD